MGIIIIKVTLLGYCNIKDLKMKRLLALLLLSFGAASTFAAVDEFTLTIKDHAFDQKEIIDSCREKGQIVGGEQRCLAR